MTGFGVRLSFGIMKGKLIDASRFMIVIGSAIMVTGCVIMFSGCSRGVEDYVAPMEEQPRSFPLAEKVSDSKTGWEIQPEQPFHLEFGRGSGREGLDLVTVNGTGQTTMFRINYGLSRWETAQMRLSTNTLNQIVKAINRLKITGMAKAYHAKVYDGTQWVFWLKQGKQEKAIYFNNHFPGEIQEFANILTHSLESENVKKVTWSAIPKNKWREHETGIWQSIKR